MHPVVGIIVMGLTTVQVRTEDSTETSHNQQIDASACVCVSVYISV